MRATATIAAVVAAEVSTTKHLLYNHAGDTVLMRYISPVRAKILSMLFFGTGTMGIAIGLGVAPPSVTLIITFMAVINIGLGAFFAYVFLTQEERSPDKRKRKKRRESDRDESGGRR